MPSETLHQRRLNFSLYLDATGRLDDLVAPPLSWNFQWGPVVALDQISVSPVRDPLGCLCRVGQWLILCTHYQKPQTNRQLANRQLPYSARDDM